MCGWALQWGMAGSKTLSSMALSATAGSPPPAVGPYEVEVFYDGDCPLCVREIGLIRWMDRRGQIRFTDIAEGRFDATVYGKSHDELMAEIHGRDSAGRWLVGVEVFRRLYGAVGFGPLAAASRLPGVSHVLDAGYAFFAKRRLWLTGRCADGSCRVPNGRG